MCLCVRTALVAVRCLRGIVTSFRASPSSPSLRAVEFDNVDAYSNGNGRGITAAQQLAYNIWLAQTANSYGLAAGLKNDLNQVAALQPYFQFAVNEQCFQYQECSMLQVPPPPTHAHTHTHRSVLPAVRALRAAALEHLHRAVHRCFLHPHTYYGNIHVGFAAVSGAACCRCFFCRFCCFLV